MKYLNIEPFHFASEDILSSELPDLAKTLDFDNDLLKYRNSRQLYSVMLDDTITPKKPQSEKEVVKLLKQENYTPNVSFLETSIKPIVLYLLGLIGDQNLVFSKNDVWLKHDRNQLLIKSSRENFDCRDLSNQKNNYHSTEIIDSIKPTCVFYTVAWYLFRLMNTREVFISTINDKPEKTIQDFIDDLIKNKLKEESFLVTVLPKEFKPNEKKENIIANSLSKYFTPINSCKIHKHYYY